MSDINGNGYGDKHNWQYRGGYGKATQYVCRECSHIFWHHYDVVPNIFRAMQESAVPEECKLKPASVL